MARRSLLMGIAMSAGLIAALASPVAAAPTAPAGVQAKPSPPGDRATQIQKKLKLSLGSSYAGTWVAKDGTVTVATTDAAEAASIRAAGAKIKKVARTEAALNGVHSTLNGRAKSAAKSVTSWYVDAASNTVVVEARDVAAARDFVRASGVDANAVKIVKTNVQPRLYYDLIGGERYWTPSAGCSVAFSVTGGFITAGHCATTGTTTEGGNGVAQGTFGGSSFPGNDYAWVNTNSNWTPTPRVNAWNGTYVTVNGATAAPVGTAVCRSGSTTNTQLWCGTIQQLNATVNYAEGSVSGLIRTNICADPGDSGGALITQSGGQAQGITSGGSGSCSNGQGSGDQTYFQPVTEVLQILAQQGRQLVTSGGGDPGEPPPTGACDAYATKVSATLSSGQSGTRTFTAGSGTHQGCLDAADGVDFDLYLQKQSTSGTWSTVASSTSPGPDETVTYTGTAGTYRWLVHAYSGSGALTLGYNAP